MFCPASCLSAPVPAALVCVLCSDGFACSGTTVGFVKGIGGDKCSTENYKLGNSFKTPI